MGFEEIVREVLGTATVKVASTRLGIEKESQIEVRDCLVAELKVKG